MTEIPLEFLCELTMSDTRFRWSKSTIFERKILSIVSTFVKRPIDVHPDSLSVLFPYVRFPQNLKFMEKLKLGEKDLSGDFLERKNRQRYFVERRGALTSIYMPYTDYKMEVAYRIRLDYLHSSYGGRLVNVAYVIRGSNFFLVENEFGSLIAQGDSDEAVLLYLYRGLCLLPDGSSMHIESDKFWFSHGETKEVFSPFPSLGYDIVGSKHVIKPIFNRFSDKAKEIFHVFSDLLSVMTNNEIR